MAHRVHVKICGLRQRDHVAAAVAAGARYLGFNFFAKSPRYVDPETAAMLAREVPPGVAKVILVVDADDATLEAILKKVPADMLQLHGGESPARVAGIRARYGLPVMKAVGIADASDLQKAEEYAEIADQLLLDAKPVPGAELPGGNGVAFDWRLIGGRKWARPWLLAGGLTPGNVAEAIRLTGARQLDVSSGVESAPGIKDVGLIADFITAARGDTNGR